MSDYLSPLSGPLPPSVFAASDLPWGKELQHNFFPLSPIMVAPGGVRREARARVVPSGPSSAATAAALHPAGAKLLDAAGGSQRKREIGALQQFVLICNLVSSVFSRKRNLKHYHFYHHF